MSISVTNRPILESGAFRIETNTGKITLSSEPQLTNYTLLVRAVDSGRCPGCPESGTSLQSNIERIEVEVLDRNFVAPTFTSCPSVMTITEMAPAGTEIGTVGFNFDTLMLLSRYQQLIMMIPISQAYVYAMNLLEIRYLRDLISTFKLTHKMVK